MKQQQFTDVLENICRKNIPETVNLLPGIEKRCTGLADCACCLPDGLVRHC